MERKCVFKTTENSGPWIFVKKLTLFGIFFVLAQLPAANDSSSVALRSALLKKDLPAVRAAVADARKILGDKAGVPETPDKYSPVAKGGTWLTKDEVQNGFTAHFSELEKLRWWRIGLDPTKLTRPLRDPASVLSGNIAACRAKLNAADQSLAMARDSAEFLMWAQEQAGSGLFPFPAARGATNDKAMAVAKEFLQRAEEEGLSKEVVQNGWAINDLGDGGLQFDNGECGVVMFEYYELTHDEKALASACKSADWAMGRPLVRNWNYNSFSVYLLAKAFAVTGEKRYLDAAKTKALIGVIPGQLTDGPHVGRWLDPHNARPAYHYILLRSLAQLADVMPVDNPSRAEVVRALALGLKTRNGEIVTRGVMTKDKAIETLLLVQRVFAKDAAFLRDTESTAALDVLVRAVSAEARRGKSPIGPREWGLLLEHIKGRREP